MKSKFVRPLVAVFLSLAILFSVVGVSFAKTTGPSNSKQGCMTTDIKYGENVTAYSGNVGVNMPNSAYFGPLQICRNPLSRPAHTVRRNIRFVKPFLYWTMTNVTQSKFLYGINYVYFRLNNVELQKAYNSGSMAIYYWDSDKNDWTKLYTSPVTGEDPMVLKAIAQNFGYFGLGITNQQ
jgi:hypothetical protein